MKMLLLAAGFGTRLLPLTKEIPKCMVKIANKPLLQYWLEDFEKSNFITELYINTHYLHEVVEEFLQSWKSNKKITLLFEKDLLGTGATIIKLSKQLQDFDLFVAHADNFTNLKIDQLIKAHKKRPENATITMASFKTTDPKSCGIIDVDSDGVVISFEEKPKIPKSNNANAAIYCLSNCVVEKISKIQMQKQDFSFDIIPLFVEKIYAFPIAGYHLDIGTIVNYEKANEIMISQIKGK